MPFPQMVPLFNEKYFDIFVVMCSYFEYLVLILVAAYTFLYTIFTFDCTWIAEVRFYLRNLTNQNQFHLLDQTTQTKQSEKCKKIKSTGILPITIANRDECSLSFLLRFYLAFSFFFIFNTITWISIYFLLLSNDVSVRSAVTFNLLYYSNNFTLACGSTAKAQAIVGTRKMGRKKKKKMWIYISNEYKSEANENDDSTKKLWRVC